jgi:hypothetical protein
MDDIPFDIYLSPRDSDLMVSIMAFGQTRSGAKTLGWVHLNGTLKNDFENLGVLLHPTDEIQKIVLKIRWGCLSRCWR